MSDMRSVYSRIYRIEKNSANQLDRPQSFFYTGSISYDQEPDLINQIDTEKVQKQTSKSFPEKRTASHPLILPPPALEARQIIKTNVQAEEAHKEALEEDIPIKEKKRMALSKYALLPKHIKEMLTPFSPMLSWSPSLPSRYSNQSAIPGEKESSRKIELIEGIQIEHTSEKLVHPPGRGMLSSSSNENSMQLKNLNDDMNLTEDFMRMLDSDRELESEVGTFHPGEYRSEHSTVTEFKENGHIIPASSVQSEFLDSLEEEFTGMLEEQQSDDSSDLNPGRQDEVFTLLLDSAYSERESSSDHPLNYEMVNGEADSHAEEEAAQAEETPGNQYMMHLSEESSSYEGEFSRLLRKACSLLDDEQLEETIPLQDKFLALLEESTDSNHLFHEVLVDESCIASEYSQSESGNDDDDERYDKVSTLLEHFSDMLQGTAINEQHPDGIDESSYEIESQTEESTNDEAFCTSDESSSGSITGSEERTHCDKEAIHKGRIVKLPVLVGKTDLEITIFDCYPLDCYAGHIIRMECAVSSLSCKFFFPSSTGFIKGLLIADIMYAADNQIKSIKIPISIEQSIEPDWICTPNLPQPSVRNEYLFQDGLDSDHHFEYYQEFSEEISCKLKSLHVLWHSDVMEGGELEIQGKGILSIDFLQEQYMHI
ncbi:hypothetical protein [Cytobacillus firmus]|uniref:hypothetical protein n=1 Tax=Cytobacillus firmus TaxID=1399 RepID=UPI001C971DEE|nr:hypothetical protein [Cytobacillus firmus]MBY6053343.1 hypothetical protein [Cytobacillus firmus]